MKKVIVYFENMPDGSREVAVHVAEGEHKHGTLFHLGVLERKLSRWLWAYCFKHANDIGGLGCSGLTAFGFRR